MFKITGNKNGEVMTVELDKDLNITFNGVKNECFNDELELLMQSPSGGGTYCPEQKTELHIYLTLKERFFDEVLKEEVGEMDELEHNPNVTY